MFVLISHHRSTLTHNVIYSVVYIVLIRFGVVYILLMETFSWLDVIFVDLECMYQIVCFVHHTKRRRRRRWWEIAINNNLLAVWINQIITLESVSVSMSIQIYTLLFPLYYSLVVFFFVAHLCHFSTYFHTYSFRLSSFDERVRYLSTTILVSLSYLYTYTCINGYALYNTRHYNIDWLSIRAMTASPMMEHLLLLLLLIFFDVVVVVNMWWRNWKEARE